jgi:hypothetical protein
MAQLIKPQIIWTEDKINMLKAEYPLGNKTELALKLGIKRKTLKAAANRFGVQSLQDKNFYKLKPLYENSLISYYWMGFIMADGNINDKKSLRVSLSVKDELHLKKLADFLNIKMHYYSVKTQLTNNILNYCTVACSDAKYAPLLLEKFGLNKLPKTYNPPTSLPFEDDKYFLAFFTGFIDGDGAFSKGDKVNCDFIRIELHGSWLNTLQQFELRLNTLGIINTKTGLNSRGYSYLKIYKHQNLVYLKRFAISHSLPILDRKWNSVNTERVLKARHVYPQNTLKEELIKQSLD